MASRGATLRGALAIPGGARPTPAPQGSAASYNGGRGLNAPSIGQVSPLAAQLANEGGYARIYGGFLPRPPHSFTQGAFGPFSPILPVPVDEPPPDAERPEARRFEYRVGWNLPTGQPGQEGLKLSSFQTLKSLADSYSVARACIEFRKNQVRGIDWDITPTPEAAKAYQNSPSKMADFGKRRAKAVKFFSRPDRNYYSYATWLSALLEEVLVFDALSLLIRPVRGRGRGKGVLGSDLDSLMLVDGSTVRPLLDLHGGTPAPPGPAYQQYLYGVPRSDFMSMIFQEDLAEYGMVGQQAAEFRGDQLIYMPMIPRAWTPYGFPPIERALIPIMTGLQKQGYQYDWFSECHDDETEILTRDGWKLFDKLDDNDEVATRAADGEFQWQKPMKRQKYWHDAAEAPLVHFENRTVDILVTQNHRMLVRRPEAYVARMKNIDGSWRFRPAGDFIGESKKWELPLTSFWRGSAPAEFVLEKDGPWHREFRAPMVAFCEFLGLYLAEGWTNGRNCILIGQTSASRHMDDIKRILDSVGLRWRYFPDSRKFAMADARLTRWLNAECGHRAWNKHVPDGFKDLTPECLEKIWSGLIMGDGVQRENGVRCLISTSSRLVDDCQEILQKLGINGRMVKRNRDVPSAKIPHYLNGRLMNNGRQQYVIGERMREKGQVPIARTLQYSGFVYCVTVPNGVILTRRNGKQAWTGNSTVPAAYVIPGDTAMTPNQYRELQDALNAIAGDPAWKQKIIVLPSGSRIEPQKPVNSADELDHWLANEVTMAFGMTPMEIGITAGRSSSSSGGAQNQMAKMTQDRGEDTGLTPFLKYLADIFNLILREVCGQDDMQFTFEGLQQEEDQDAMTGVLVQQFQNGLRTLDECRQELNLQPYGLEETSEPLIVTPQGVMPISTAVQSAQTTAEQAQAQLGVTQAQATEMQQAAAAGTAPDDQNPNAPQGQQQPRTASASGTAGGKPSSPVPTAAAGAEGKREAASAGNRPQRNTVAGASRSAAANSAANAPTRAAAAAANREAASAKKQHSSPVLDKRAAAELGALARHLCKGRPVSTWDARFISQGVLSDVAKGLAEGLHPEQAVKLAQVRATVQLPASEYEWVEKVGPKGYVHGWVCVRPPCGAPGDAVTHHDHGSGIITHRDENGIAHAKFSDGTEAALGREEHASLDYSSLLSKHYDYDQFSTGGKGDHALEDLAKIAGFDAKPCVTSDEELDARKASGEREMWRGMKGVWGSSSDVAESRAQQFMSGDYYGGIGHRGNGTYVASYDDASEVAKADAMFAGAPRDENGVFKDDWVRHMHSAEVEKMLSRGYDTATAYAGTNGAIMRMTLDKNARTIDFPQLLQEWYHHITGIDTSTERGKAEERLLRDQGRYAITRGYDAVILDNDEILVLNRGKVHISDKIRRVSSA